MIVSTLIMALVATVLLYIPTTTLTLYTALGMQGRFVPMRILAVYGVLAGISLSIYRNVNIPFPAHIALIGITVILIVKYLGQGSWGMAILCGLAAHLTTAVGEGLITAPLFMSVGISLQDAVNNPWLVILGGWLAILPLLLIAIFINCQRQAKATVRE